MYTDFSWLFQYSSKDKTDGGRVRIPSDDSLWPDAWKTTYYKSYGALPKIELPEAAYSADLFESIQQRHSSRTFSNSQPSIAELSALLRYSCGITREGEFHRTRAQPSGGARSPIELYVLVLKEGDIPTGVYHYNVGAHALDVIEQRSFSREEITKSFTYAWVADASYVFILTAVFERTMMKYGTRGFRYIMLEAGHIGQNLYLVTAALQRSCCAMGGSHDQMIEQLLDIDGITESVVHTVVIG